jgi:hypothetical protein
MSSTLEMVQTGAPEALDNAGATASFLCAVHCALMPMAATVLPVIGLGFVAHEMVEWMLIGLSATLGIISLTLGFRAHRSLRALLVLGIGLGLLCMGRLTHPPVCSANHDHTAHVSHSHEQTHGRGLSVTLLVLGGLTVAGAHLINRSLCHTRLSCKERA